MIAVIMAGGYGSRIASIHGNVPKPMLLIGGKPILEHQIEWLKGQSITEVILVVGYLHQVIEKYFGDGNNFGMKISYIVEDEPLGTAGALYFLKDRIKGDFLLLNGDIMFDIDLARFTKAHCRNGGIATIFTHPNQHPYDSAIVIADQNGRVTGWLHREDKRKWYQNRVNAGLHILSSAVFEWLEQRGMLDEPRRMDLDRDVLKPMIAEGLLYAYYSSEYVKDMGTPERYRAVERDFRENRIHEKNLANPQKAVFLDRDGTINEYVGFLRNIEDFRLLEGTAEAVRLMNENGWLVIVVTNQPVIARGEVTEEELAEIHRKMETLLGEQAAYIDAVYYCPHHPDRGFEGEKAEYKIVCNCRKPSPGMIQKAAKEYNIDPARSWMVGDSDSDMEAGAAAGCHTAGVYGCSGERAFRDLKEFAEYLCGRES